MENAKADGIGRLERFLQYFDYGYWWYKVEVLKEAIEDQAFRERIASRFTKDGRDARKIQDRLIADLLFTNLQMIESLFFLIGALTDAPKDPWQWINDHKNSADSIAKRFNEYELKGFYEKLGIADVDDYIRYLFYELPVTDEYKKKLDLLIEPTKAALRYLAAEFFKKKDLYNAFKHGSISMPIHVSWSIDGKSGKSEGLVPDFPALMYLPKRGRKSNLVIEGLDLRSDWDSVPEYVPLNYQREKGIYEVGHRLIRNLINSRKAPMVERAEAVNIALIPSLHELAEIFKEDGLYVEVVKGKVDETVER